MALTVITMYRGKDAETFVQVVEGVLTDEQKEEWSRAHCCDDHYDGDEDDMNNMTFCVIEQPLPNGTVGDLLNIDGGS